MWFAQIATIATEYFTAEIEKNPRFLQWFYASVEVRSGFEPRYSDEQKRNGLFALSMPIFDEMKRRLQINGKISPHDPIANIRAGIAYLRWLFDRYETAVPDIDERIKCALFALDAGYFHVKFALEKCAKPATFAQLVILVRCDDKAEKVREIIKFMQ